MIKPLLSDEYLTELAVDWMQGDRTKLGLMALMRMVERATSEACAVICDDEAKTIQHSVIQASITIRRRMGA